MDSITLKFDSIEQLQLISGFVNSIIDAHNKSSQDTIVSLNNKLESMDSEATLSISLSKDECSYLGSICTIISCISADDVIAGCDISSKIAKSITTKSDVPWFLALLEVNHIPVEYCIGLFSSWCSCEGSAVVAEKCMDIQAKYGINMTTVWKQLSINNPYPDTCWTEEVDRYKEAINGRS